MSSESRRSAESDEGQQSVEEILAPHRSELQRRARKGDELARDIDALLDLVEDGDE